MNYTSMTLFSQNSTVLSRVDVLQIQLSLPWLPVAFGMSVFQQKKGQLNAISSLHANDLPSQYLSLTRDYVVFQGGRDESAGQVLTGSILIRTSTPSTAGELHLQLLARLSVPAPNGSNLRWGAWLKLGTQKSRVSETVTFDCVQAVPAFASSYECPFEVSLPGYLDESIEGLPEMELKYRLQATFQDATKSRLGAIKSLRLIRAAATDAEEQSYAEYAQGVLDRSAKYSMSVPQIVVTFGGVVEVNVLVVTLGAGMGLESVTLKVTENRESWSKAKTGGYGSPLRQGHCPNADSGDKSKAILSLRDFRPYNINNNNNVGFLHAAEVAWMPHAVREGCRAGRAEGVPQGGGSHHPDEPRWPRPR